jgi:hypothetical protein
MIARPSWEKPLRKKLRKGRKRRVVPRWLADLGGAVVVLFILQCHLAHGGENTLGHGGGGTGIGAVSGLIGALLAISLRSRWQSHGWLLDWTPATPAAAWKLRTREHLRAIVTTVVVTMLLSCLAAGFNDQTSVTAAFAAGALSMGCGFLLAGGRISTGLLFVAIVLVFFYTVLNGWSGSGGSELSMRMAKGTDLMWLPVLPWSLATHGTPTPALHLGLLALVLMISLYEWRSAWSLRSTPAGDAPELAIPGDPDSEELLDDPTPAGEEAPEAADEDQRQNIRQHVAFAWFGMAGYLPDGPMPGFERILWRWFSPRERFLSCLGSQQSFEWFPRTRWTAGTLVVMVIYPFLASWLNRQASSGDYFFWLLAGFLALAAFAIFTGWPGRDSCFQSWLDHMHTADLGLFPAFAVMPVTASEWLGGAAKEWIARSVWISSLWSMAILLGCSSIAQPGTASWLVALTALPWLSLAAWFPLSVMHRLARAVSGPIFRSHGISRVLPALLLGVMGLIAMAAAFVGIGTGNVLIALMALAVAVLLGAISLRLTLQRCRDMKLDLKPTPLA